MLNLLCVWSHRDNEQINHKQEDDVFLNKKYMCTASAAAVKYSHCNHVLKTLCSLHLVYIIILE